LEPSRWLLARAYPATQDLHQQAHGPLALDGSCVAAGPAHRVAGKAARHFEQSIDAQTERREAHGLRRPRRQRTPLPHDAIADFDFQDHVRLASNRSHLQNAIEVFDGPAANCCRRRVIALHFDSQLLLRTVLTLLNVELRLVPTVVIAPMITTDMSAAINPYSIAVAPVSSSRNAATMPFASPRRRRIAKFI